MCFARKSEQRAIIFLHTALLVSTTQIVCVYCAVRTRFLNTTAVNPYSANVGNMVSSLKCQQMVGGI
jgi:hypothetical protein